MRKNVLLHLSIVLLLNNCGSGSNSKKADDYFNELNQFRTEKNLFFKNDPHSPLPSEVREYFDSLYYFPIDPNLRIIAEYLRVSSRNTITIPLNNGQVQTYIKHGFATFTLDGTAYSLMVLVSEGNNAGVLFLPFYDKSNGFETYGGGRYLEPLQISESKILLDFNRAYNPFCVYSPDYVCPLPPNENMLPIPIKAGEKTFEKP